MKCKSSFAEYGVWLNMKQRCNNKSNASYKNYGGRGIKVCRRWEDFYAFLEDMGPRPHGLSIERVDNDKGYSPENCVWADKRTQSLNKRNNFKATYHGTTKLFLEWCEELELEQHLGLTSHAIYCRIKQYGWSVEKAFTVKGETLAELYVNGEMLSVQKLSAKYGVSEQTIRSRKLAGLIDGDLVKPVSVETFTVGVVSKTVREWSKICGQSESTTRKWLEEGKPLTSKSVRSQIEFMGKSHTLINWAKQWDLDRKDLSRYLVKQKYTMKEVYDYYVLGKDWAPLGITKGTIREPIEFMGKRLYPSDWRAKWGFSSSQFSRLRKKYTMQEIYDGFVEKQ